MEELGVKILNPDVYEEEYFHKDADDNLFFRVLAEC